MRGRKGSLVEKATDDNVDSYRVTMPPSKANSLSSTETDVFVLDEKMLKGCIHPPHDKFMMDPENALEKCKKCCEKGQCSIKELLEACEKDPDSILAAYKKKGVTYAKDCVSYIRQTHGEKFGDPKYHYLMVDVSTSIEFPEITKKITYGTVETVQKPPPPSERKVSLAEESIGRSEASEGTKSIPLSDIYASSEDQERSTSRQSTVSWSGLSGLLENAKQSSKTSVSDSIEQVVLKATADAEKFRKNQDVRKHYSHLGEIVRGEQQKPVSDSKRSTIESKESSDSKKSIRNCFGFMMKNKSPKVDNKTKLCNMKKGDATDGNCSDDSDAESPDTKRSSLDSYKRRSSPVEHAVFETDKAINKYLSNM